LCGRSKKVIKFICICEKYIAYARHLGYRKAVELSPHRAVGQIPFQKR